MWWPIGAAVYNPNPGNGLIYTVTVPEGTKACYIAGDMTGWLHQEMERIDDTHYTITMGDATEADGYKYCSGPGWQYEELTAEGASVSNRTYTPSDVVARWAMIYEPDAQSGDIHFNRYRASWYNRVLYGRFIPRLGVRKMLLL